MSRGVKVAIVVLYLATVAFGLRLEATIHKLDHEGDIRRQARNEEIAHDRRIARDAFVTTCDRQNRNRDAIRAGIVGTGRDIGDLLAELAGDSVGPETRAFIEQFRSGLVDRARKRAVLAASRVDCTYPPKPPTTTTTTAP